MATTENPTKPAATPDAVRQRIKNAYGQAQTFIQSKGNARLQELWPEWKSRFERLYKSSQQHPQVAISLVGDTGAGKSTLLNALVGARVLPVSNMRACTAAITEVAFAEGGYHAHIEFVSRESWQKEIELLLADWRDATTGNGDGEGGDNCLEMSRAVRDRLWAVYKPSDDADPSAFSPSNLVEPPEVAQALDKGVADFKSANLDDFRKSVAKFLDSKHRFWPIVKSVTIGGPFAPLRDGAKIIDLPGINDPNEAREAVTRAHLKTCRFVWLIFNIKRALTKATINLMQSDDFLRQVVMDGRTDSLTFVGTASDDVDLETGIEEFDLSEEAALGHVIAARNLAVRKVVVGQLDDLAIRLANLAREQRQVADKLAGRLRASQIYTVSAREFLRVRGETRIADHNDTEIPILRSHMQRICADYGITAHSQAVNRQLDLLISEIKREIQSQQATLRNRAEIGLQQRQEVKTAAQAALGFLDHELQDTHERLAQDLAASNELLAERVRRAVDRARSELDNTFARWERMHWATLRAVCRRGGAYVGSTGKNDLPADLSKPILDSIAFAWSDFFGEKLQLLLQKWTDVLLRHADDYRRRLMDSLGTRANLPPTLFANLDGILETTEKVLKELLGQINSAMEARIQQDQRSLYESVPTQVKANMQDAFEDAALESGTGMKKRMVAILANHAGQVSQVMFDDARESLLAGLRSLNDWLAHEFCEMTAAVGRHASLAAENLLVGGEKMSDEAISREKQPLEELAVILDSLLADAEL